jgi:hypothetical protein
VVVWPVVGVVVCPGVGVLCWGEQEAMIVVTRRINRVGMSTDSNLFFLTFTILFYLISSYFGVIGVSLASFLTLEVPPSIESRKQKGRQKALFSNAPDAL